VSLIIPCHVEMTCFDPKANDDSSISLTIDALNCMFMFDSYVLQLASLLKIFPGVSHGWTVRYNVEDEPAVKSAEEAHRDMLHWFTKFVK